MKCPNCNDVALVLADRQGIEIDYCPQCRGVWLDRGELDKIIERSSAAEQGSRKKRDHDDDDDFRSHTPRDTGKYSGDDYSRRHKKKSLLGDLFDFKKKTAVGTTSCRSAAVFHKFLPLAGATTNIFCDDKYPTAQLAFRCFKRWPCCRSNA